jgi:RNA polymerase sigma factor (sigma-70 family)
MRSCSEASMDRRLVEQAQGGDHAAFCELAGLHIGRMLGIARLILRDEDAAQDAVQETLVATWRGLPGLRDPDRFEAWLRRLLIRSCTAQGRDRRHRAVREIEFTGDGGGTVADIQRSFADRDQLEGGLRLLTRDQRTVLVLTYYLDLPLSEAAQTLGVPVGTLKSRLNRALGALKATLDADARVEALTEVQYS